MIEIRSLTHTVRLYADEVQRMDLFKLVLYCGYRGDLTKIPRCFTVIRSHSCVTDLTISLEELLSLMKSNTRNEIRRAAREGCSFNVTDDLDRFVNFYNAFCESKGFPDYTDRQRLQKYEKVLITEARHGGDVLAMHANILDEKSRTALLLYSCSPRLDAGVDKKMIGWGNRFLHFEDLKWLKSHGYVHYDWAGVVMDPSDSRYSIGQFKLAFGGKLIDSFSLKSPLFSLLEGIRNRVVRFRR